MTKVRLLNADDVETYRRIRLEALRHHPEAFGTTQAEEAAKPIAELLDTLENHTVFGGFRAERLSGIAILRRQTIEKERHKATLWGMYVAEAARGTGALPVPSSMRCWRMRAGVSSRSSWSSAKRTSAPAGSTKAEASSLMD